MSSSAPRPASLESLRKRAKDLRRAFATRDPDAVRRVRAVPELSHRDAGAPLALAQAQLVVAREQGFASWPKMKRHVEIGETTAAQRADLLVEAALSGDLRTARELAKREPSLAASSLAAACVLGDAAAVASLIAGDSALVRSRAGARRAEPLFLAAWSRFLGADARRAAGLVAVARTLLAHGADPNTSVASEAHAADPQTALYGASGVNRHAGMTKLLLDAGADPNDSESLYHACESADPECLRLLLAARPRAEWVSYCLARKLDFEDVAGTALLLDHGADPNFVTPHGERWTRLHHAIARGRSAAVIAALLDRGADPGRRDGIGRTAYVLAVQRGRDDAAALLAARGTAPDASERDRFLGACSRADTAAARALVAAHPRLVAELAPHEGSVLVAAAAEGRRESVRTMLALGFDPAWTNEHGATALHSAAFRGDVGTVELLLAHAAPLEVRDRVHDGTPLGWAIAGSTAQGDEVAPSGDAVAGAAALLAAGACPPVEPRGSGPMRALLRRHLRGRATGAVDRARDPREKGAAGPAGA